MINSSIKIYSLKKNIYSYTYYLLCCYKYLYSFNNYKKFSKIKIEKKIDTSIISLEDLYAMEVEDLTNGVELDFEIHINKKLYNTLFLTTINFLNYLLFNSFILKLIKNSSLKNILLPYDNRTLFSNSINRYMLIDTSSIFMANENIIDHVRYFNIELKNYSILDNLTLYNLVRQRYGIGPSISKLLLNYLGVSYNSLTKALPINEFYTSLSYFFSSRLLKLDNYLLNFYISKHSFLKKIKSYRGFRLVRGYPSNGQRTRSNHKTSLRKPYYYSFYFI